MWSVLFFHLITSIMYIPRWIKPRVSSRLFRNHKSHASHSPSLSNSIQIAHVPQQGLTRILRQSLLSSKLITTTDCTKSSNFSHHQNGLPTQVSIFIFTIPCQKYQNIYQWVRFALNPLATLINSPSIKSLK